MVQAPCKVLHARAGAALDPGCIPISVDGNKRMQVVREGNQEHPVIRHSKGIAGRKHLKKAPGSG